jgi:hypothetical protein
LQEIELAFDEVDGLIISHFESQFRMIGQGEHTGARLPVHLKDMHDCFELTHRFLLGIMSYITSSNYSTTHRLQSTLDTSGIKSPGVRNHIQRMTQIIRPASGALMSSLAAKGRTKAWKAHERHQQYGENESIDNWKSQRL